MNIDELLTTIDLGGLLSAIMVLLITWLLSRFLRDLTARLAAAVPSKRLTVEQGSALLRFAVVVTGIGLALRSMFALSDDVLKVLGGTIVVTVGLALKDQASSVLAGILILVEKPFSVGDRVNFAGHYGEIRSIGLRAVRLITLDDNEVTIPNHRMLTEAVASGNSGALDMLVQQDFHIGADQDLRRAKQIVQDCLTSSRYFYPDKPWAVLVSQVTLDSAVAARVRAKAYVVELRYEKAFESDVALRVMTAFRAEGILPPAVLHRGPAEAVTSGPRAA